MPKSIKLYCKLSALNWDVLSELPARLAKLGFASFDGEKIIIWQYPHIFEFDNIGKAVEHVHKTRSPRAYSIHIWEKFESGKPRRELRIDRGSILDQPEHLYLQLENHGVSEDLTNLGKFLGLEPDAYQPPRIPERKCFIAHRFDAEGNACAAELEKFLKLLGFAVSSGKAFSTDPISEKVKQRVAASSIVFAILTPGEDPTWLVQEQALAAFQDKPLFILKESRFANTPGLLTGREYIPFETPQITTTFVPILEGLRNLGLEF